MVCEKGVLLLEMLGRVSAEEWHIGSFLKDKWRYTRRSTGGAWNSRKVTVETRNWRSENSHKLLEYVNT